MLVTGFNLQVAVARWGGVGTSVSSEILEKALHLLREAQLEYRNTVLVRYQDLVGSIYEVMGLGWDISTRTPEETVKIRALKAKATEAESLKLEIDIPEWVMREDTWNANTWML
jgi:hypothetical protein